MTKFRIITNGERFRVQRKGLFGRWHSEGTRFGYGGFLVRQFDTKRQAQDYILSQVTVAPIQTRDIWQPEIV